MANKTINFHVYYVRHICIRFVTSSAFVCHVLVLRVRFKVRSWRFDNDFANEIDINVLIAGYECTGKTSKKRKFSFSSEIFSIKMDTEEDYSYDDIEEHNYDL
mgnify:FL=1